MLVGTVKEDLYLVIIFWHSSMKFMCSVICLIYIYIYSHTLQCNFMVRSLTSAIVIFWSYVLDTLSHSVKYQKRFYLFLSTELCKHTCTFNISCRIQLWLNFLWTRISIQFHITGVPFFVFCYAMFPILFQHKPELLHYKL